MNIRGICGYYSGREFKADGCLFFGRSPQDCNILFPDQIKGISRRHCKIEVAGGGLTLTDMGSSYGTFLNGMKLTPYSAVPIKAGDTFWLGNQENSFTICGVAGSMPVFNNSGNTAQIQIGNSVNKRMLIIGAVAAVVIFVFLGISTHYNSKIKELTAENDALYNENMDAQNEIDNLKNEIEDKDKEIEDVSNKSNGEKISDGIGAVIDTFLGGK